MMIKQELTGYIGHEIMDAYFDLKKQALTGEAPKDEKEKKNNKSR